MLYTRSGLQLPEHTHTLLQRYRAVRQAGVTSVSDGPDTPRLQTAETEISYSAITTTCAHVIQSVPEAHTHVGLRHTTSDRA